MFDQDLKFVTAKKQKIAIKEVFYLLHLHFFVLVTHIFIFKQE